MSLHNNSNVIEEIKDKVNIVDVVGEVVSLKRAGSNYKGLCPFHSEKTPSFVVSEEKQLFTCFGCGATGNVFEFIKRYHNLEFWEAVETIAGRYNIPFKSRYELTGGYDHYYEINREAAKFFFNNLIAGKSKGLDYILGRGIAKDTIKQFGIGYAKDEWDSLCKYFAAKGTDFKTLKELGLVSEKNGRYYDKFRNRVIFPIINTRRKVIGFGGRAIGDDEPKYLNSPENVIFHKKDNLYGLNLSRSHIIKEDRAILVEGYMDVVSLYQGGIKNVSASLGTALTDGQARLLRRASKNVILAYDSDSAGKKAALRGIEILTAEKCVPQILHIEGAKDPDEFIKNHGKLEFEKLLDSAEGHIDYRINAIKEGYDMGDEMQKIAFIKDVARLLSKLSPVEAEIYVDKLSRDINISSNAIKFEIAEKEDGLGYPIYEKREIASAGGGILMDSTEQTLIKLALLDIEYFLKIKDGVVFRSQVSKEIFSAIKKYYEKNNVHSILPRDLQADISLEQGQILEELMDNILVAGSEESVLKECISKIKKEEIERQLEELNIKISIAEEDEEENSDKIKSFQEEFRRLQKELLTLKERQAE